MIIDFVDIAPTGSYYICNPPVTNTDLDFIVLIEQGTLDAAYTELTTKGWVFNGSRVSGNPSYWFSVMRGKMNLIVTDNALYYERFLEATEEAKRLNLTNKKDRMALFTAYQNSVTSYPPSDSIFRLPPLEELEN